MELLLMWIREHPGWAGIVGGVLIGFLPSVYAGHLGNRWTERRKKKTLEGKQKEFTDGLSTVTHPFITTEPINDAEVAERRKIIADEVKRLSQRLFDQPYPEISSIRPENTEYPEIPCKWCHRQHKAFAGSKGECTNCRLPLVFGLGVKAKRTNHNWKHSHPALSLYVVSYVKCIELKYNQCRVIL